MVDRGGRVRWGAVGGGIFAKTAKTPPLQSALHVALRPNIAHFSPVAMRISCTPHASHLWGPSGFYHATLVREGTRYARHLPYRDIMGNLVRNGILFCKPT